MRAHPRIAARREREARRGRLGKGRFDLLVKELVAVIRLAFAAGATATLFGLEGPLRAGIRADLCRQGWRWQDADDMAREMLDEAFRAVRATRPGWDEGQPEWTIHAGTLIERTRCARCHAPLPEGHHKFCSNVCAASYNQRFTRLKQAQGEKAVMLATRWI
ncbi:hypothetical protein EB844_00145 [Paracoccus pantotrophus]|nr:hypothetical protein EB844_00145 [Paracoccus pantotrophus]